MRAAVACAIVALASHAAAAPLPADTIAKLCNDAEGPEHCGRLIEAEQQKRLPGLIVRDGRTLRVSLFPNGSVAFTDVETSSGGTSFSFWDYLSEINAAVIWRTVDDTSGFILLQRTTGKQAALPSEPALSPDRQRFATADFCATRCENALAVWRVDRDGARRELEWRPGERWIDAAVRWKDAQTLVVEYTPEGETEAKTLERKLADPSWSKR
jgi:hypothetical protein